MVICFDIGGTTIKAAAVRSPDHPVAIGNCPTPTGDFAAFCSALAGLIAVAEGAPSVLSVAITGVVDPDSERIKCANIPCIDGRRLASARAIALGFETPDMKATSPEIVRALREAWDDAVAAREETALPRSGD